MATACPPLSLPSTSLLRGSRSARAGPRRRQLSAVRCSAVGEVVAEEASVGTAVEPLLVSAIRGKKVERPPVWLMRQAGRYMKSYQLLCERYPKFRERSENVDLVVEISLQPWKVFKPDGVILFSDILTPLPGMNIPFDIVKGKGPVIYDPLRTAAAVNEVREFVPEEWVPYVGQALNLLREEVKNEAAVLGFVGAPFTLASYCVEGGSSKNFTMIKKLAFSEPTILHNLLQKFTTSMTNYIRYQADNGAQAVQIFDSWATELSPTDFEEFSLPYLKQIVDSVRETHPDLPLILYASGSGGLLERLPLTGVDVVTNPRSASASAAAPAAPSYDELFGSSASAPPPTKPAPSPSPAFDSIFDTFQETSAAAPPPPKSKHSSMPVYDKPVYDDDIFVGVPGVKSSSARYDDVFGNSQSHAPPPAFDDLVGGFGKKSQAEEKRKPKTASASTGFDDLIPGFGGRSSPRQRDTVGAKEKKVSMSTSKPTASMASDPFVVLETTSSSAHPFIDPLDELGKPAKYQGKSSESTTVDSSLFEDPGTFNQASKSEPLFTSEVDTGSKDRNGSSRARGSNPVQSFPKRNSAQQPSVGDFENIFPKSQSARYSDVHVDIGSEKYSGNGINDQSPRSDESEDEIWLTVSEIPLFTQPTSAPPPSRPPPPLAIKQKQHGSKSKRKDDEYLRRSRKNYDHQRSSSNQAGVSSVDELEDFAMGKSQNAHAFNEEEFERSTAAAASAAAMKEAMDKAEAKFKHAKEVRERERDAKLRNREHQEQDNETRSYAQDREDKERKERLEQEREMKQKEEKEREQRRLEEERELERQRERDRARQAVERATKEARERAAAEARAKAEREARQRSERAAVQRAQQEARERAAVEAKERAERATAEAKEKAASQARDRAAAERAAVERAQQEARKRAERAAVERAAAEARERQAAEARERQAAATAAAAAREKQSRPDDLESFFGMGARANSAPKQRAPTVDSMFETQTQNRATSTSASMKKASSTTNIADDLSAIFGGAPTSSDEFQEIDGESEERRRARLERHQRTRERAAKALAEKNERDMQQQREQAERHRIAETLDFEIKRWAAGKEGNLRALLSTLQYVLWPECGWQPVSLTDLITAAAVKKVYRKATLCIHPDKVQQKGANLQQKYIAEKVFDLLKEAWNKFNSEELF